MHYSHHHYRWISGILFVLRCPKAEARDLLQSTHSRRSISSEAAVRITPQDQQQSAMFQQRLKLLNRYRLAEQITLKMSAAFVQ